MKQIFKWRNFPHTHKYTTKKTMAIWFVMKEFLNNGQASPNTIYNVFKIKQFSMY